MKKKPCSLTPVRTTYSFCLSLFTEARYLIIFFLRSCSREIFQQSLEKLGDLSVAEQNICGYLSVSFILHVA